MSNSCKFFGLLAILAFPPSFSQAQPDPNPRVYFDTANGTIAPTLGTVFKYADPTYKVSLSAGAKATAISAPFFVSATGYIYKQNDDGTWPDEDLALGRTQQEALRVEKNSEHQFDTNQLESNLRVDFGPGTYRFVYDGRLLL